MEKYAKPTIELLVVEEDSVILTSLGEDKPGDNKVDFDDLFPTGNN